MAHTSSQLTVLKRVCFIWPINQWNNNHDFKQMDQEQQFVVGRKVLLTTFLNLTNKQTTIFLLMLKQITKNTRHWHWIGLFILKISNLLLDFDLFRPLFLNHLLLLFLWIAKRDQLRDSIKRQTKSLREEENFFVFSLFLFYQKW